MLNIGAESRGTLVVQMDYHTEFTFYMTVSIPELRLTEEINFTGKRLQVPPGTYTVILKGLMGDPRYAGPKYAAFGTAYGSFERKQIVDVRAGKEAVCRFTFMGDVEHVTVRVVVNGEPVTGAEILVEGAEKAFMVIRDPKGILFHLQRRRYPVVVSYRDILVKDTIPVGEGETEFVIDLTSQITLRPQLVVVRYLDGRMVKGTTDDFDMGNLPFTIRQPDGAIVRFDDLAGVKAAFFVKRLEGNPQYKAHKDFTLARQFGRRTLVLFRDGEIQKGYTLPEHCEYPYFFLFPVDPNSNNDKVYIIREATKEIRLV